MESHKLYSELALEAYNDEINVLGFKSHFIENKKTGTQCHVLISEYQQIVSFRGTQPPKDASPQELKGFLKDLKTDLDFYDENGIHGAILESYLSISDEIYNLLNPIKKTVFIGHSLGGGLAQVALFFHKALDSQAVVFGSPRVFSNKVLKEAERLKITRYESKYDPIPYLPPYTFGFRHVGDFLYINGNKIIRNGSTSNPFFAMLFSRIETKFKGHSMAGYCESLKNIYGNS